MSTHVYKTGDLVVQNTIGLRSAPNQLLWDYYRPREYVHTYRLKANSLMIVLCDYGDHPLHPLGDDSLNMVLVYHHEHGICWTTRSNITDINT